MLNSLWHIKTFLPETTPQGFPQTFLTDKSIKESGLYRSLNVFFFFRGGRSFTLLWRHQPCWGMRFQQQGFMPGRISSLCLCVCGSWLMILAKTMQPHMILHGFVCCRHVIVLHRWDSFLKNTFFRTKVSTFIVSYFTGTINLSNI